MKIGIFKTSFNERRVPIYPEHLVCFWPNLVHPRLFLEKAWRRMLHDRNPLLTVLNDKFRVSDYSATKKGGGNYLLPMLGRKPYECTNSWLW